MKNKTETRNCGRNYSFLRPKTLILAGLAVIIALGISSLALYTRPAATQELDKNMPTLKGDPAIDLLKKDKTYRSLEEAIAKATKGDNPEAVVKLTAPDARTNDFFGTSVAISGNTLIVGASQAREGNGGTLRGAAYIFIRNGAGWSFQQKLTGDGSGGPDGFGVGVAISGDTVVVAAPDEDLGDDYDGVAYVFVRNGTTWSLQKKLTPADTPLVEGEGWYQGSVAISGDTILVGSQGLLEFSDHETMVHVFVREGTMWTPQAVLTSIDEGQDVRFGHSVAISGDIAVVGDPYVQNGSPHMESTYIFVRCGTTWTRQQRLTPNDGPGDRKFGGSVAISGNTVIIGADQDRLGQTQIQGSAYVFVSDGTTWTQQQKLTSNVSISSGNFGRSVAIFGDLAIVGMPSATIPFDRGSAFAYIRSGTTWTSDTTITAPDGVTGDNFGSSVAISSASVVVGANDDDFGTTQTREGSAYVIDRITQPPAPFSPCETEIEVNITTDQPDADLEDDVCDVDANEPDQQCSLRAAIETANAKAGPDEISFNIPGAGAHTISPATALPVMFEKVLLDATTQPGYSASPLIALTGTGGFTGLAFDRGAFGSSVSGMAINRFFVGISITSSSVKIERNYIGLDPGGSPAGTLSVQQIGIAIRAGSDANTIGGIGNLGNVISNNTVGVEIASAATGNKILGNKIGTNPAGTLATANETGVLITFGNDNKIGDGVAGSGNIISGNAGNGIRINLSSDTKVKGNIIGLTAAGEPLGNGGHGILLTNSSGTIIGGEGPGDANMIGANTGSGIEVIDDIPGASSDFNQVIANLIGCFTTPSNPTIRLVGNGGDGIRRIGGGFGGPGLRIGSAASVTAGNTILGNGRHGILLETSGNRVPTRRGIEPSIIIEGNNIGVARDSFAMGGIIRGPNALSGILSKVSGVKIGGIGAAAGNSIGANAGSGILIEGPAAEGNEVLGNFIGAIRSAQGAILAGGNGGDGIKVSGASVGTKIGGIVGGAGNTILNNAGNGILLEAGGESATLRYRAGGIPPTVIEGNKVGVELDTFAMGGIKLGPNGLSGILSKVSGVKIGGIGAAAGNSIGANVGSGILIEGPAAEGNEVLGNFVGAIRNAQGAILAGGNGGDGIKVSGASVGTKIGGIVGGAGNTILNNAGNGILVEAGDESITRRFRAGGIPPTVIEGNKVGVELDTFAMGGIKLGPNGLSGILTKAIGVKIGGTGAGAGNSIGANIGAGIKVEGPAAELNEILGNFVGAIKNIQGAIVPGLGNGGDGISVGGGAGNKIGGNVAAAANMIVNNAGNGVTVSGAAATDNEVHGNLIGTTTATIPEDFPLGAATTGNGQDGIVVRDAPRPQIGRADTSYRNVVAFNAGNGVRVDSASTSYDSPVYVYGNNFVGNAMNGILTTVQHNVPHIMEGNTVRNNAQAGIKMTNSNRNEVIENRVENNVGIGVILDGIQTTLINVRSNIINENGSHGVDIDNGANTNNIGGSAPNQGNTITNNGGNGIRLGPGAGSGNNLDPNIIFGNTLGGIDLGGDGFTLNDPTDADSGPNNLQNYPTLTVTITGGDLIVSYQVDSAPANSVYGTTGIRAEFFEANAVGEGSNFLGFDIYTTQNYTNGTPGTKQINLGNAAALGFVPGDRMTATATDTAGNSSEFTPAVTAPGGLGFEGDVAPRPNGDGNMLSTDITQMRRFVSGLDTPNPATNEAQRIDSAPRSTFGDGIINSSDVVQGRRYVSGLDVMTPAGGPASRGGSVPESIFIPNRDIGLELFPRELSIGEPEFRRSTAIVPIELTSHGNEVAMSFTLEYDQTVLANPRITLGKFAPAGSTLTVNTTEPGRIGILIDSTNAMTGSGIPLSIAMVSFEVKREASGEEPIYMTGSLAATGISDAFGNSLSTKYVDGIVRFDAKMY